MTDKYVDVRDKRFIELLDSCSTCKEEFAAHLMLRHKCETCAKREMDAILNRPLFDIHWKKMWEHFERMFKAIGL